MNRRTRQVLFIFNAFLLSNQSAIVLNALNFVSLMFHSGMLPEAIIPPSEEHSYAQWLEEHDHAAAKENQENLHLKAHAKGKKRKVSCGKLF